MYLFKDFILSINYGPTNGCGSHLCDVSPAPSPSLSLHLFAPSLSTLGVSIFIPLCIFTYFLARNIKVASIVLLPNIVWLLLLPLPGSGGCMGEAVGCVFAKLWLPGYLSLFLLLFVRASVCDCVCVSSLVRSSCLSACAFGFHLHMKLLNNPFVQQSGRHPCPASPPLATSGLSCPGSRRTCIHFVFRSVRIRKCLNICKSS